MKNHSVYVPVYQSIKTDQLIVKEICAGLEEEGVPYKRKYLEDCSFRYTALKIGILVSGKNEIAVFYENLPEHPYIQADSTEGRKAGQNAARLVKGQPLIIEED